MPDALLLGRPHVFERGDKVYLTTPLTLTSPTDAQVEEFAFASAVKDSAPNEHIGWLQGRYVEAGRANLNGAMWLSDELALKSLTPMLMPVTVMHDPRTAVGTIADCKLIGDGSSRIDTILAIWKHRFSDIWEEAASNIDKGTMMQSMECLSPSYTCSECGQQYLKLQEGKERASWCEHLRSNSSRRILQDVCFTGTGLIFGSRGGKGAYTEAYLDHFQDEIAEYHEQARIDSTYRPSERSAPNMGLVQIEESELATLRRERDDARSEVATVKTETASEITTLTSKVEQAEAATTKERERAEAAEAEKTKLAEAAEQASLKDKRLAALGQGFMAKLGEFTRERLTEAAAAQSDEEWESTLKEKEEMAGVKRDAAADSKGADKDGKDGKEGEQAAEGSAFTDEEVARFTASGVGSGTQAAPTNGTSAAQALARSFAQRSKPKAEAK